MVKVQVQLFFPFQKVTCVVVEDCTLKELTFFLIGQAQVILLVLIKDVKDIQSQ
jgi:hypothetical protein